MQQIKIKNAQDALHCAAFAYAGNWRLKKMKAISHIEKTD